MGASGPGQREGAKAKKGHAPLSVHPKAASAMLDAINRQPSRGRPRTISDRTGGQIDDAFDQPREHVPGLIIDRLQVTPPAHHDPMSSSPSRRGRAPPPPRASRRPALLVDAALPPPTPSLT